jgi:hypothetical protein
MIGPGPDQPHNPGAEARHTPRSCASIGNALPTSARTINVDIYGVSIWWLLIANNPVLIHNHSENAAPADSGSIPGRPKIVFGDVKPLADDIGGFAGRLSFGLCGGRASASASLFGNGRCLGGLCLGGLLTNDRGLAAVAPATGDCAR